MPHGRPIVSAQQTAPCPAAPLRTVEHDLHHLLIHRHGWFYFELTVVCRGGQDQSEGSLQKVDFDAHPQCLCDFCTASQPDQVVFVKGRRKVIQRACAQSPFRCGVDHHGSAHMDHPALRIWLDRATGDPAPAQRWQRAGLSPLPRATAPVARRSRGPRSEQTSCRRPVQCHGREASQVAAMSA